MQKWKAIRAQLKGLPIVLRLSEVREGHFNLPWGEGEMQWERDGQALKQKLRGGEGTWGQKGVPAFICQLQVLYHHTSDTSERTLCSVYIETEKRREAWALMSQMKMCTNWKNHN